MRTMNLIDLTDNPNFVSGIHNYCDRWCERCPLTARCAVYANEEADSDNNPASRDISNAAFWEKLASIFQETREMISLWAEENGIVLSGTVLREAQEHNDRQQELALNHPLAKAAEDYAGAVNRWFESSKPMEVHSDLAAARSDEIIQQVEDVNDYIEVIRWYQFFIAVKVIRGLSSRVDEDDDQIDRGSRDSNGSVKTALIAIDRSLSAWKVMGELCHENSGSIEKMLLSLEMLRLRAEEEFPQARDFIRPGFDEDLYTLH